MKPTIQTWRDGVQVDAVERRIAWLESQVNAAEDAIAAQREIIDHDGMSFSYKLSLGSLEASHRSHLEELSALMQQRQLEALNFALVGAKYEKHRAGATVLAEFIGTMQQLYLRIAQGINTGSFTRNIDPVFKQSCQLEIGFFQSSFGIQFITQTNTDLTGQSVAVLAMERTMSLVTAEQPLNEAAAIGPYALRQYRKLIKTLIEAEAEPRVDWRNPSGQDIKWTADHNRLITIANRLAHIKSFTPRMREISGTLVGASLRRQRFEFAANGLIITGAAPKALSEKVTAFFNKPCTIQFSELTFIDETTEQEKRIRTLIDIQPIR